VPTRDHDNRRDRRSPEKMKVSNGTRSSHHIDGQADSIWPAANHRQHQYRPRPRAENGNDPGQIGSQRIALHQPRSARRPKARTPPSSCWPLVAYQRTPRAGRRPATRPAWARAKLGLCPPGAPDRPLRSRKTPAGIACHRSLPQFRGLDWNFFSIYVSIDRRKEKIFFFSLAPQL